MLLTAINARLDRYERRLSGVESAVDRCSEKVSEVSGDVKALSATGAENRDATKSLRTAAYATAGTIVAAAVAVVILGPVH